jgi:hypothetical protein
MFTTAESSKYVTRLSDTRGMDLENAFHMGLLASAVITAGWSTSHVFWQIFVQAQKLQ